MEQSAIDKVLSFGIENVDAKVLDLGIPIKSKDLNKKFDLVISVETFEHIRDTSAYLQNLKSFVTEDGVLILTCPNDLAYYPNPAQENKFHVRKYSFDDFKTITESILGPSKYTFLGAPTLGYSNILHSEHDITKSSIAKDVVLKVSDMNYAYDMNFGFLSKSQASYFVLVWDFSTGGRRLNYNSSIFSKNMEVHDFFKHFGWNPVNEKSEFLDLKARIRELELFIEIQKYLPPQIQTVVSQEYLIFLTKIRDKLPRVFRIFMKKVIKKILNSK
jgi:SAM-dependent methyltransferase